ncbi:hypothetical protein PLICRDRAFT_56606 [Plicaturopsis crispa FD-325 SS-3]|nr:hypothetical protein PLICRDRAFT_56606 [Plicaturopsis crispa FD-325 SS-3]
MHSFASISFIATLALGAFARPLAPVSGALNTVEGLAGGIVGRQIPAVGGVVNTVEGVAGGVVGTATGLVGGILGRDATVDGAVATVEGVVGGVVPRDAPRSLAVILTDVQSKVTPLTQTLTFLTSQNATKEVITPITDSLKAILGGAVTEINGLVGQPISVIKAAVDPTVQATEQDLAKIVADVICVIVTALGAVLKIAGADVDALKPILASVGTLVGQLLATVLHVLSDLLALIIPLVKEVVPILLNLNISSVLSILGIQL